MVVRAVKLSLELDKKEQHPPRHGGGNNNYGLNSNQYEPEGSSFHDNQHEFLFSVLQFEKARLEFQFQFQR